MVLMKTAVLTKNGKTIVESVEMALGFWQRSWGLLGRKSLGANRAIYLAPCASVHTFFMRFRLDLVFLDREGRVIKIRRDVRPYRVVCGGRGVHGVLELESGCLDAGLLEVGDVVQFE